MNRGDSSKLHLPGGTIDRTNQLAFLSLGDGGYNTFVGFNAGNKFPSSNNTFIGTSSGQLSERVSTSVFMGSGSGQEASRSGDTIAIGYLAGAATRDSYSNVLIGTQAGQGLRRADFNTAVGHKSMALMASGRRSVAIGAFSALQATATANSVYVGYGSGYRVRGSENVFVGGDSGQFAVVGNTVAIGYKAAEETQDSIENVFVGTGVGRVLQESSFNVSLGASSTGNAAYIANSVYVGYASGFNAEGTRNVCVGSHSGTNVYTVDSTLIGFEVATALQGNSMTVVGSRACGNTAFAQSSVVLGANSATDASDIVDTVVVGYEAARSASNVNASVIVGAMAGSTMMNSDNNVIVGYATARTLENSSYNTLIGSESVGNAEARYSTLVGSKSMNRRNGERVEFSNCVIVGENITFDLPVDITTLRYTDARRIISNGSTFYDSNHLFADPFVPLVASPGGGEGYILYPLTEALPGMQPLTSGERDLQLFGSFEVSPGSYTVSWYSSADNFVVTTSKYDLTVTITSNTTHHTLAFAANVESIPQAPLSKTVYVANASPAVTWMDLLIHQMPEPEGIDISYSFVSQGSTISTGNLGLLTTYASSHPSDSYLRILAQSSGSRKGVYSTLSHAARSESGMVILDTSLASTHTLRGSGTAANVDTLDSLRLVYLPTHTGFTAAEYDIGLGLSIARIDCTFQVPLEGTFGAEWLSNTKTTDAVIGDGFVSQCRANGSSLEYSLYGSNILLFHLSNTSVYSLGRSVIETPHSLPINISTLRSYSEVWGRMYVIHDLQEKSIVSSLRLSGYATGGYVAGSAAQLTQEYTISTSYEESNVNSLQQSAVSIFGSSSTGNIIARDLYLQSSFVKSVPSFERCIFIGSNFTVQNDEKDTLVMSLGPQNVIHATPNVFTISSDSTRLEGQLTIGSSEESNYLAFRGLYNDGFTEDIPTAYIGERVYIPSTEKSELLLAKGEDPIGIRGPDRIRLLSGEIRVDTFANVSPGGDSYVYNRANFESIATANTTSVLVANGSGVYFPSMGIGATEFGYLKGLRSNIQQQLDNSFVTVTADKVLISNSAGRVSNSNVNSSQLWYLNGVTSNIQLQLNGKQATGDYVTSSSLNITLGSYVTSSSLSTTLGSYVTSSSLSTTLGSYVTSSSLSTTLGSYVTTSSLSTTLTGYATDLELSNGLAGKLSTSGGTLTGDLNTQLIKATGSVYASGKLVAGTTTGYSGTEEFYVLGEGKVSGAFSKGSGTFDIQHPCVPSKRLVHSFIEGPRIDLLYRGTCTLHDGMATIDLNRECVDNPDVCGMTPGTFQALCRSPVVFLQNNETWDHVRGFVDDGMLYIECENPISNVDIQWMVIAERRDAFILQWRRTDNQGRLVTEYIEETIGE